jgi:hypothetical protein
VGDRLRPRGGGHGELVIQVAASLGR